MLYLWLPLWVDIYFIDIRRSRGKSISRAFPKVKSSVVRAKFPVCSKFHFSQWKTYYSKFIDKFLKFEEIEYLNHHVNLLRINFTKWSNTLKQFVGNLPFCVFDHFVGLVLKGLSWKCGQPCVNFPSLLSVVKFSLGQIFPIHL